MNDFLKSKSFKILIVIIALLFGMMLFAASSGGVANIPKNLLSIVAMPFQKASTVVANSIGDFFSPYIDAKKTASSNAQLEEEVVKLREQLIDYEKTKDENEQLKKIAGIKEIYPDFSVEPAVIISRDPNDRYGSFIIDKGSLNGVSPKDPIITDAGIVGIVSEVGAISSRVKTILSPEIEVSVMEMATKELGIVAGDLTLAQDGITKMSILSQETKIVKDNIIITAGSGGIFPKGVPIGTVKEVKTQSHGVTMLALITPVSDVKNLKTCYIVTDFLGQGSVMVDYLK
ncbi:MAG: rod shape-determining protein MreC [Oscillospiraceae bacterium]